MGHFCQITIGKPRVCTLIEFPASGRGIRPYIFSLYLADYASHFIKCNDLPLGKKRNNI